MRTNGYSWGSVWLQKPKRGFFVEIFLIRKGGRRGEIGVAIYEENV